MTNFISSNVTEEEKGILFGDMNNSLEGEEFVVLEDDNLSLENIMVNHLNKFKSATQARKNNWGGPIPKGFKKWKIGKIFFWTYIPLDITEEE